MKQLSKNSSTIVLILAIVFLLVTLAFFGWEKGTIILAGKVTFAGCVLFLKSNDLKLRIAGLLFFGLGLFWLLQLPMLIYPPNVPPGY